MRSKLFTPKIREKRGDALDATEERDMFVNVPTHAEVPSFQGPTDEGKPCYPLRMSRTDAQQFTGGAFGHRKFVTAKRGDF